VEVDRTEYEHFKELGMQDHFTTYTDKFISLFPKYENKREDIDKMHEKLFAVLKKKKDGYCELLDPHTMLCTVYEKRPKVCRDYLSTRCKTIRELKHG